MPSLESQCYPHHSIIHLELQPEIEAQLAAKRRLAALRSTAISRLSLSLVPLLSSQRWMKRNSPTICNRALGEIAEGNTLPARRVFAQLREEYDIRG